MIASKLIGSVCAGLILVLIAACAAHAQDVPRIGKDALKAELGGADLVVIDVRTESDWNSGQWKIQGAVREDPSKTDDWKNKYPKDKKIVLYCA